MSRNGPATIGKFLWNATVDRWSWDEGMFALHGYRDQAVPVTTAFVLQHKVGKHQGVTEDVFEAAATSDGTFSNFHQIADTNGRVHTVLSVGESRVDRSRPTSSPRVARGFMIDVTQDENDSTRRAVKAARQNSAPIQQSLGLLMGSFGLSEEAAFALMARVSSTHNVKLRDVARRFIEAAVATAAETPRDLSQTLLDQATALAQERAHTDTATK